MCMAIPMQVLRMEGFHAVCLDRNGVETSIDTLLVGAVEPGQWLLTFLGAAREVVDVETAGKVGAALAALEGLMAGGSVDLDAHFADLVNREPQLPVHLQHLIEGGKA
jgi:hydrogenase expression/formation protein HypC